MNILGITHSCCPGKQDIYAPAFQETEHLATAKGTIVGYTCLGCKTVIHVMVTKDAQ